MSILITIPFYPSEQEQELYECVQKLLEREGSYALPKRHQHLTGLILRKLLSSSTKAVLNNLQILKNRLERLKLEGIAEDDMDISLLKWGLQKSHHLPVGWLSPQEEVRQVTIYEQKAGVGVIATPIHITHSALQLFLLFNDGAISLLSVHSIFIRLSSLVPVED